jgi:hypothetical protein
MSAVEWKLRRELAETKLQLYSAQSSYLQLAAQLVRQELDALGPEWTPDDPAQP